MWILAVASIIIWEYMSFWQKTAKSVRLLQIWLITKSRTSLITYCYVKMNDNITHLILRIICYQFFYCSFSLYTLHWHWIWQSSRIFRQLFCESSSKMDRFVYKSLDIGWCCNWHWLRQHQGRNLAHPWMDHRYRHGTILYPLVRYSAISRIMFKWMLESTRICIV